MARYNEIQVGRFNRFLQKLLSMKGEVPSPTLAGDIQPVMPVEFDGVENRYLFGWDRFTDVRSVAAQGVGTQAIIQYRNPANSNAIAVFEKLTYISDGVNLDRPQFLSGATNLDQATILTLSTARIDPRGRFSTTLVLSIGSTLLAGPVNRFQVGAPLGTTGEAIQTKNQELPLLPGDALLVQSNITNLLMRIGFMWRERFLEDSERA